MTDTLQPSSSPDQKDRERVLLLGATGTIGQAVATVLKNDGHEVRCVIRPQSDVPSSLSGLDVQYADATDFDALNEAGFQNGAPDVVISCMASRTGVPDDAWAVDYLGNMNALKAAEQAAVKQFVLLSAICVQKPRLAFQKAKLAFEEALTASGLTYSIVRPTAFFKSLSGQVERVMAGKPYLLFGDGQLTACKPISDADLASYIVACLRDPRLQNRVLPIGGPGPALTPREQGEHIFELIGRKPTFSSMPVFLMDAIIAVLSGLGAVIPPLRTKAELARIGRYYATESMLVFDADTGRYDDDATPSTGSDTLFDYYADLVAVGGAVERGAHKVF